MQELSIREPPPVWKLLIEGYRLTNYYSHSNTCIIMVAEPWLVIHAACTYWLLTCTCSASTSYIAMLCSSCIPVAVGNITDLGSCVSCDVVGFDVVGCDVVGCDVVGCAVVGCAVVGCAVVGCDVVGCDVVGCDVVGCNVVGCDVVGCDVVGCDVVGCAVVGCIMSCVAVLSSAYK